MMSFRLSDDQYHQVRALCGDRGIDNVSELVRAAVSQFLHDRAGAAAAPDSLDCRMGRVERQLQALAADFDHFQRGNRAELDTPELQLERNQ
jgi:Arc/MetJ-type ribon-helix-helix transcriptional regulator